MENCVFCSEFRDGREPKIILENGSAWDRVILSDGQWNLVPTLGCFTEGYTLLILSEHQPSLYYCSPDEKRAFVSLLSTVQTLYIGVYQAEFFMFEHGIVNQSLMAPTSVNHVHIHLLPFTKEYYQIENIIQTAGYKTYQFTDVLELNNIIDANHIETYLLYFYKGGYRLVDITNAQLPSQYLRMVIYQLTTKKNDGGWNWKTNPCYSEMKETYGLLSGALDRLTINSFKDRASRYIYESEWITDKRFIDPLVPSPFLGKRFLDVACGTGLVTKKAIDQGWDVTAVDICAPMLEKVSNLAHKEIGDAEHLKYKDNSFDLVVCRQGLQYMRLSKALNEMIRVSSKEIRLLHATVSSEDIPTWKRLFTALGYLEKRIIATKEIPGIIQNEFNERIEIAEDIVLFSNEKINLQQRFPQRIKRLLQDAGFIARNHLEFNNNTLSYRLEWHLLILKKRMDKI